MGPNIAINGWTAEAFWERPPELPPGLTLLREHMTRVSPRAGRGGQDAFEEITLGTPAGNVGLLAAYKAPVLASDVASLRERLWAALDQRRGGEARLRIPVLLTDRAPPSVREACQRERLGLIDQAGTVILHDGPVYVHVEGRDRVRRRPRANLFQGKGARALRCLLDSPGTALQAKEIAARTQMSFSYCYALLLRLESEGFVDRRTPRTGFRLIRPVDLLRKWIESGYRAAASIEPFYAPSTSARDLDRLAQRLERAQVPFSCTLLTAIPEGEIMTGGIPHGLYLGGDVSPAVEELALRKVTPHNFLVLRPEADAAMAPYGVFRKGARFVSRPQLILDLVRHGGARGREQAEHVLHAWARDLPVLGGAA